MRSVEFKNAGEHQPRRMSLALPVLMIVAMALVLLAVVIVSGTTGPVDVSIPTRMFPGI